MAHGFNADKLAVDLRAWRRIRGLTQADLATRAGVSIGTVRAAERATRATNPASLTALAQALGLSYDDLVAGARPMPPAMPDLNPEDLAIARAYHHAATDIRTRVRFCLQAQAVPDDQRAQHFCRELLPLFFAMVNTADG